MTIISAKWLRSLIDEHKKGKRAGVYSVCSSHPVVLKSSLEFGKKARYPFLIEATCNQVNQQGGYTGLTPEGFVAQIENMLSKDEHEKPQVLLGGDHLGPYPWRSKPEQEALQKGVQLVRDCVLAGYRKIHLDASFHLSGDDPQKPVEIQVAAERTAQLLQAAEEAANLAGTEPVYVIGSEVPAPGGEKREVQEVEVTSLDALKNTIEETQKAVCSLGFEEAWQRVIAVVTQPGVEFHNQDVNLYDRDEARDLSISIEKYPQLVFEAHSTDYQTPASLKNLVKDHFLILKVGPELTFAYREGVFALEQIELALAPLYSSWKLSNISQTIEEVMVNIPQAWQEYYEGSNEKQAFLRKFSLLDRIRYYWNYDEVKQAVDRLLANLDSCSIPLSLISQYFPGRYQKVRSGVIGNSPESLLADKIQDVLRKYHQAVSR